MKIAQPLLLAGALAALPLAALASNLNYNYVEGGYLKATQEDGNANDFDFDGFTSSTSVSQKRVSPWKTGFGWLSSSVARLAIALPETSLTDMPSASE